ncbi:PASTA domain-containing protein [Streptomyces sp. NPDC005574]|uniref:PASTA domain-containing protein n=1 Tax=Streptomyces sp. NPDC005574 TaxID=3156891 RepID=UPI0033AA41EC
MNRFVNSAEAPAYDAPQILLRTRRRRTIGIAAVAAALIAAGGGTALATSSAGSGSSSPAATSTSANSDATTVLYVTPDGTTIPIDFANLDLTFAKQTLLKAELKTGAITKAVVKGCKPGSVVGVSPHAPKSVKSGATVNLTLCAG